jgi:hypothetical protein
MSLPRVLLIVLVLAIRLTASSLPMPFAGPADGPFGGILADAAICHTADSGDALPGHAPSPHPAGHEHDCGLCPICHVMATPALLPLAAVALPPPLIPREGRQALLPPATGPPAVLRAAASPRGPPASSV